MTEDRIAEIASPFLEWTEQGYAILDKTGFARALLAAGASEGQAFDEWFDREYPLDDLGRRSKYQSTNVLGLMQAAWSARDAEIAALRERIAGMEKDAERLDWLDRNASSWFHYETCQLSFDVPDDFEGANNVRTLIDAAIAKEPKCS